MQDFDYVLKFSRGPPWWEGGQSGQHKWAALSLWCTYMHISDMDLEYVLPKQLTTAPHWHSYCRILTAPCRRDEDSWCSCCCPPIVLPFLTAASQTQFVQMLTMSSSLRYWNLGWSKLRKVLLLCLCSYPTSFSLITFRLECHCFFNPCCF